MKTYIVTSLLLPDRKLTFRVTFLWKDTLRMAEECDVQS